MNQIKTEIEALCELMKNQKSSLNKSLSSLKVKISKLLLKTSINSSSAIIERFLSICESLIRICVIRNFKLFEILDNLPSNFKI
jgi:hypothetical protein